MRLVPVILALVLASAPKAFAQTDYEITSAIQFNFANPGARSLGVAGAMTGLGDDATGAWTNPGALTNLTRPEASAEFRSFGYSNLFTVSGRAAGAPTGIGIDTVSGLVDGERNTRNNVLSFASYVLPRDRWAVAFYRTQTASFSSEIETDGPFAQNERLRPVSGEYDVDVAAWGASAAFKLTEQFSVGGGVALYTGSVESRSVRYGVQGADFFRAPNRSAGNVINIETLSEDDTVLGAIAGVSWTANPKFRLGASYRQGVDLDFRARREVGPGGQAPGTVEADQEVVFRVPDVFAGGVLVRPVQQFSIAVDVRRIMYSQMTDDFAVIINVGRVDQPEEFVAEDGTEIRAGVEYVFTGLANPIAIRGGTWFDPDHRIRFESSTGGFRTTEVTFRPGADEWHATGGVGITLGTVQLDTGFDYSERVTTFAASAVLRF